jgi:hypothetical protein
VPRRPEPELPISFQPVSNGEYALPTRSPADRRAEELTRRFIDEGAARTGVTRREFLRSSAAMAATLTAIDLVHGGGYVIDPHARFDSELADQVFAPAPFVFDVQGHLLEYDLDPSTGGDWFWGRQFPQAGCRDEGDPRACFSIDHFLEEVFVRSDTTMVALSGLPILPEGSPLSNDVMEETRRIVDVLSTDERVVVNAQALPQIAPIEAVLEEMARTATEHTIRGWKTFTHFGGAWWLDDHDPALPQVGDRFLEQLASLGSPILCVHKGLSDRAPSGSPRDIGPAARTHPDVAFVVYHSGFEVATSEGPYTAETADAGVNRLITSLAEAGVGPGGNVYAEIGSTWWHLLKRPREAGHVLGKLLKAVGEDNLLWGTDSIFYGSPQPQIDAFRAFQTPAEMRELHGYPELTDEIKNKVLGRNAARLYGVDPVTSPLRFDAGELTQARSEHPLGNATWGPKTRSAIRRFRAHHEGWP